MNVKDLLALAYLTPDQYVEVPEAGASAALAGDIVIVTVQPPMAEREITVSVHTHDGNREVASECFGRMAAAFNEATAQTFADTLDHTPVNASYFV